MPGTPWAFVNALVMLRNYLFGEKGIESVSKSEVAGLRLEAGLWWLLQSQRPAEDNGQRGDVYRRRGQES